MQNFQFVNKRCYSALVWCVGIILITVVLIFESLQESHAQYGQGIDLLQGEQFSFRLRDGNRKEGILRRKPVSGGVELTSATIDYRDQTKLKAIDSCFVGFFLQQESEVQITIHEPKRLYMMTPLKRTFPSGFSKFGWPRYAVLAHLNIDVHNLYAVAEIQNSDPLAIAPVVLFYVNPPVDTIKGYRFIFRTDTRSDFKYHILKPTSTGYEIIYENQLLAQPPGEVLITWDGKDRYGRFMEDGSYQLNIIITLYSYYEADRKVVFIRDFYHKCKLCQTK